MLEDKLDFCVEWIEIGGGVEKVETQSQLIIQARGEGGLGWSGNSKDTEEQHIWDLLYK